MVLSNKRSDTSRTVFKGHTHVKSSKNQSNIFKFDRKIHKNMSITYSTSKLLTQFYELFVNYIFSKELIIIFVSVLSGLIAEKIARKKHIQKWKFFDFIKFTSLILMLVISFILLIVFVIGAITFIFYLVSPEVKIVW